LQAIKILLLSKRQKFVFVQYFIIVNQLLLRIKISMETETRRKDKNKRDYV